MPSVRAENHYRYLISETTLIILAAPDGLAHDGMSPWPE
jgi:hypothetical protein